MAHIIMGMDLSDNPFVQATNPFVDKDMQIVASEAKAAMERASKNGRKLRPDGTPYSSDPSIRMRQLHEDGRAGPAFGHLGGARRKADRRATEVVAEAAREHAEKIRDVLIDGLDEDRPYTVRMKSALELLKIDQQDAAQQLEREKAEFEAMNKAQLVDNIMRMLNDLQRAGQITAEIEEYADAQVVDDDA